jgi:hypothetical protein
MVLNCAKSDGSIGFSFKKEDLREMGEIINDGLKIFGMMVRFILE